MAEIKYFNKAGERVPGVTTVIGKNLGWNKQALLFWANRCGLKGRHHRDVSQPAADKGTAAHRLIECHLKNIPIPQDYPEDIQEAAEMALLSFLQWEEMVGFEVLATEQSVISEEWQAGGTLDCLARIKGKRVLFDWKSGGGIYPDMMIQLEAYRHFYDEVHPDEPIEDGFTILRIEKETVAFDWSYRFAVPDAWEAFKLLRQLHNLKKRIK